MSAYPRVRIRQLYDRFDAPVTRFDCGTMCAPYNPRGIPFCCDICQAVPAAYHQEWDYFQLHTDLWRVWQGTECPDDPGEPADLLAETPEHMLLLACQGPARCQREYRALSCRQFPFFPYITAAGRFLGLAYEWTFEPVCWVVSHLGSVTGAFREEFVRVYDELLSGWQAEFEAYALKSEEMRAHFLGRKRRIPLLHRDGGSYLLSPSSERLQRLPPERLPRFGPYRQGGEPPGAGVSQAADSY